MGVSENELENTESILKSNEGQTENKGSTEEQCETKGSAKSELENTESTMKGNRSQTENKESTQQQCEEQR